MTGFRCASRIPLRVEVTAREPADGFDERLNGAGHEGDVEVSHVVAGLVVGGWRSPASSGVRDNALQCKCVVIGALKEVLLGVGVGPEESAVFFEGGAEIGSIPAREEEDSRGHLGILVADHFELEVGNKVMERNGRMLAEVRRSEFTEFF